MTPKQKREQKLAAEQWLADMDWLTSDARGRRLFLRLLRESLLLAPARTLDPGLLQFREGQRTLVEPFLAVVASNWPDRLTAALTEHSQGAASSDDRADDASGEPGTDE